MMRVYKYDLPITDYAEVKMPVGASILSVHEQFGSIKLWAMIDDQETETETRYFRVAGTGHELTPWTGQGRMDYIDSVYIYDGKLVYHIFEVTYGATYYDAY